MGVYAPLAQRASPASATESAWVRPGHLLPTPVPPHLAIAAFKILDEASGVHAHPEHGPGLEARVRKKFEGYHQVKIFKGNIPEVFEAQSPASIAYLHIDLNEAQAEIAALDALFERVVPGGVVILDDYEWSPYRSQKIAEDPWFEERRYRVFPLPTGQGIVIKR